MLQIKSHKLFFKNEKKEKKTQRHLLNLNIHFKKKCIFSDHTIKGNKTYQVEREKRKQQNNFFKKSRKPHKISLRRRMRNQS